MYKQEISKRPDTQVTLSGESTGSREAIPINDLKAEFNEPNTFEYDFYTQWYNDLRGFSKEEAQNHWTNWGQSENRVTNFISLANTLDISTDEFNDFDYNFYLSYYSDLKKEELNNIYSAYIHYKKFGKNEMRVKNLRELFIKIHKNPIDYFDKDIYLHLNRDLIDAGLDSELDAFIHYKNFGQSEYRLASLGDYTRSFSEDFNANVVHSFNSDFYRYLYDDINEEGLNSDIELKIHFAQFGWKERRYASIKHLQNVLGINKKLIPALQDIKSIIEINAGIDLHISSKDIISVLEGNSSKPIYFFSEKSKNSKYYILLAKEYLKKNSKEKARRLLSCSLYFRNNARALEYYANTYIDESDYNSALKYYSKTTELDSSNPWPLFNKAKTLKKIGYIDSAFDEFIKCAEKYKNFSPIRETFFEFSDAYWLSKQARLALLAIEHSQDQLIQEATSLLEKIRKAYETLFKKKADYLFSSRYLIETSAFQPEVVFNSKQKNASHYYQMAEEALLNGDKKSARKLLMSSLTFHTTPKALEALGNTYLEEGDNNSACEYYREALKTDTKSKWLHYNLAEAELKNNQTEKALNTIAAGIQKFPEFTFLQDQLDRFVNEYWLSKQPELNLAAQQNNRSELIKISNEVATKVYNIYLNSYGCQEPPKSLNSIDAKKVLIVGDFHIPQCIRYRIDQKVEQLSSQGIQTSTIDWTKIKDKHNELSTHDLVIFYRVPCLPDVLKAMAAVNAVGKLSVYEIDDLIFSEDYPPSIESYGGYVDVETYFNLTKGMALFNSASKLCRYGIASTNSLAKELEKNVFGEKVILHRNGLDTLNSSSSAKIATKKFVDIFYGSGTQAHNSDFSDLVLPALTKLLEKHRHARLIIVGYLALPKTFIESFQHQVKILPPVNSIKAYWSLLKESDINLAVLHSDIVSGAKSELKWFEAACFAIPSVLSATDNYLDVIKDGEDALLARNPDEWFSALNSLITDKSKRLAIGTRAQARVLKEYSIESLGKSLATQLREIGSAAVSRKNTAKKKIALVNVFFPPQSIGGATRVVADNFDELTEKYSDQFDICVFTSDSEHKAPYQLSCYNHKGKRVYRSSILFRENMDWHAKDPAMYDIFQQFLEIEKPDLVHFHCIQRLTGSIVEATLDLKIPYIVTVHDAWWISDFQFLVDHKGKVYPDGHPDTYEKTATLPNISVSESIERKEYLKHLLNSAYFSLTVSESFAQLYIKNGITKIQANKNGISCLEWKPKKTGQNEKVICAHIGGMAEHKGYFLLKEVVTKVQPENIEMLIVDHSKDSDYLYTEFWKPEPDKENSHILVEKEGVKVTFIGRTKQSEIAILYSQIDVLFAVSLWPESYGLVTREANAAGCWVVASNLGGIGEDIIPNQTGYIIDPDKVSLSETIKEINSNYKKYKQNVVSKSIRSVSEQVAQLVDAFYDKAL